MRVSSFFAGIGGFDLGLERAGMNVVFQCEIDPFCQQILKRHWPHVPLHDDITTLNPATIPTADLWCAGWPCQDLSTANTDLSQVLDPNVPTTSLLTAANCLGILRRENRAKRKLDPIFVKSLSETIRLWYNVAVASGIPWQKASAPRYAPKLEDIKAAIQTDRYSVARNLTWTEWERLMGFPPGWTVAEGDSLAMPSSPPSVNGLENES